MQPENLATRQHKIRLFAAIYASFLLLIAFFSYWSLVRIPVIQRQQEFLTRTKISEFRQRIRQADTLAQQIQAQHRVRESSMLAFYEWMNEQKADYPRAYQQLVLDAYVQRVTEIERSRRADTTLAVLQQQYQALRDENAGLSKEKERLEEELEGKKAANRAQL